MIVRLNGIKRVTSKGYTYYYHRKSGRRIRSEFGTEEFVAEVRILEGLTVETAHAAPGTWGYLVEQYKRSPNFTELAPSTRKSYDEVFDYLSRIHNVNVALIDEANLLTLRDKTYQTRGRAFSNYIAVVMSIAFNYGIPRKFCARNPAWKLEKIRRPKGKPKQNRAWTPKEADAFLSTAPRPIRLAVMIAISTGLRLGDVITLTWENYQNGEICTTQSKTGNIVWMPAMSDLRALLVDTSRITTTIVANNHGMPYTKDGFKSSFRAVKVRLEKEEKIGSGLTFHGLRTTISKRIADLDGDSRDIMSITGHRNEAMVKLYTEEADNKKRATKIIKRLDREQKKNKYGKPKWKT